MVLFATDIAARGLDFPTVDWVVQVRWDWFTLLVQQWLPCNCSLWAAALLWGRLPHPPAAHSTLRSNRPPTAS